MIMDEKKESEKLAEKLTVRDTFEISAKSIVEFDTLMVEIQKKQEQFPQFRMDIVCEWDTMEIHIGPVDGNDKRQLKVKNLHSDQWNMFVNRVRKIENEIITYLNERKKEDEEKTIPIFSCNVKLRIELKDKEAERAIQEPEQLALFTPVGDLAQSYFREKELKKKIYEIEDSERKEFIKQNNIFKDLKSDGKNIEKITFQKIENGVTIGDSVELTAK
jgi:aromatic ring-cleaving dioxygenase